MADEQNKVCKKHGLTRYKRLSAGKGRGYKWECVACLRNRQTKVRNKRKSIIIEESGGECKLCGYKKHCASLDFHHLNPEEKEFKLSMGTRSRSLEACRTEAKKCVLLCRNCHGEIEAGHEPTLKRLKMANVV